MLAGAYGFVTMRLKRHKRTFLNHACNERQGARSPVTLQSVSPSLLGRC